MAVILDLIQNPQGGDVVNRFVTRSACLVIISVKVLIRRDFTVNKRVDF